MPDRSRALPLVALSTAFVALAPGFASAQRPLSGRWAGRAALFGESERLPTVFELRQQGTAITGTLSIWGLDPDSIVNGRRTGDSISFATVGGTPLAFRGRLVGDSLHLTTQVGPTRTVAFAVGHAPLTPAEAAIERRPPREPLWPGRAPYAVGDSSDDRPTIAAYLPPAEKRNGTAVIIFPGGGYEFLAVGHEGHDPARWLNSLGVASFVVRYRIAPRYHHPTMLTDAQRAIRTVRARAKEWGIDSSRIGVMGFSAGGHLASTTGTHFDSGNPRASDPVDRMSSRPDFMLLIYPVITMDTTFAHGGSRTALIGEHPDPALVRLLSNETQVTRETPPTFLMHTMDDDVVPVENSLRFYDALRRAGVPGELHVYEHGPHGVGLAPDNPVLSSWPQRAEAWMRSHGWLGTPGRR